MTISSVAGLSPHVTTERSVTDLLAWAGERYEPEARRWVDTLGPKSRLVAGYQLGWWDASGTQFAHTGDHAARAASAELAAMARYAVSRACRGPDA